MNDLSKKILAMVEVNHERTGGHCGLKPVDLKLSLEVPYHEIRDCLNRLFEDGKIKVRKGINSHLLFKI